MLKDECNIIEGMMKYWWNLYPPGTFFLMHFHMLSYSLLQGHLMRKDSRLWSFDQVHTWCCWTGTRAREYLKEGKSQVVKHPQGFGIRGRHWRLGVVAAGRHVCGGAGVIFYLVVSFPNLSQNGERWEVRWPGQRENLRFWKVKLVDLAGISFSMARAFMLGFWILLQNPYFFKNIYH